MTNEQILPPPEPHRLNAHAFRLELACIRTPFRFELKTWDLTSLSINPDIKSFRRDLVDFMSAFQANPLPVLAKLDRKLNQFDRLSATQTRVLIEAAAYKPSQIAMLDQRILQVALNRHGALIEKHLHKSPSVFFHFFTYSFTNPPLQQS